MNQTDRLPVQRSRVAGLDIHKMQITATVRVLEADDGEATCETRQFSALAAGLADLVKWLAAYRVTAVAMEATGIYWEKPFDALEDAAIEVQLLNARHVKQIRGRKTDVADSMWLARVCQYGLAKPSLVLPRAYRDLRQLVRHRRRLIERRARHRTQINRILDRKGIRIGGVLTDIFGRNGRVILDGLIAGRSRQQILDRLTHHVRLKMEPLADALSFELDRHSRGALADLIKNWESDSQLIDRNGDEAVEALIELGQRDKLKLLMTMPGVDRDSAACILVELGPSVEAFESVQHCAAWAGLCPGNNESAGKRRSGRSRPGNTTLRAVMVECAHGACRTPSAQFQSYHKTRAARLGYKKAIVATAHKMLRICYTMLRDGTCYQDPDVNYEEELVKRNAPRWIRQMEKNGFLRKNKDGSYRFEPKLSAAGG